MGINAGITCFRPKNEDFGGDGVRLDLKRHRAGQSLNFTTFLAMLNAMDLRMMVIPKSTSTTEGRKSENTRLVCRIAIVWQRWHAGSDERGFGCWFVLENC